MTNYIINNNIVRIFGEDEINIKPEIPLGTYLVKENELTGELFFRKNSRFCKA